ncbi:MAG: 50S ribosomal protein L18 [Candidatus Aenigmarchaeota archaeon ex4484_56]|nr:MAG: 50S ribosomal protein L18 [Candidatus Aenigmarchaeota archaeon ex4484_56]
MKKRKILPLKRRREGKTNYKRRLALLKSGKPRIVIRISNNFISLQLVDYSEKGDITRFSFCSKKLSNFGWKFSKKNIPAAYLSGLLFGKLCQNNKINSAVLDLGIRRITKGNKVFAVLKGCVDSGVDISHSNKNFPSENRIMGEHISEEISKNFLEIKQKILEHE